MQKAKKPKKIRKRIVRVFLTISLIAMAVTIHFSLNIIQSLKEISVASNTKISTDAIESSKAALTEQAVIQAEEYASLCGVLIESKFMAIDNTLEQAAGCAVDIYEDPERYIESPFSHPREYNDGKMHLQWILSEGMELEGEIKKETYRLGNLATDFKNIMKVYPDILEIYLTTETGINIGYDSSYASKPNTFDGKSTEWYQKAVDTKEVYISDSYEDSFGRGSTVTISYPCITKDDVLIGVIGVDILISDLNELVQEASMGQNGYAMLVSHNNQMISAAGISKDNEYNLEDFFGSDAKKIVEKMKEEKTGMQETAINGKAVYVVHSNVRMANWSMAIVLPKTDIIAPALATAAGIQHVAENTIKAMNKEIGIIYVAFAILITLVLLLIIVISRRMANKIAHPIIELCNNVKKIGDGNLDYVSEIHTNDEIEELSRAFETMTISLKDYINNLSRITADKQRIATELNVATQIQISMLPCIFPAFPGIKEIDIFATMHPAKEVGGDFYDFFLVGENKLAFVMADVSGKGVPAALFMMISKALIKNLALTGISVDEVFNQANNQLNENNDAYMFVTTFLAIVDLQTGDMCYVNAGHNPPLLRKQGGDFEWLTVEKNCVLAVMPEMQFKKQNTKLEKGDIIFTYTDGVTEAVNTNAEFYTDPRLKENLNNLENLDDIDISNIVIEIGKTIEDFANGADQADDITMCVFKYLGN